MPCVELNERRESVACAVKKVMFVSEKTQNSVKNNQPNCNIIDVNVTRSFVVTEATRYSGYDHTPFQYNITASSKLA